MQKLQHTLGFLAPLALLFTQCSTQSKERSVVVHTSDQDLLTISADYNESDALINAIQGAKDYCDHRDQIAVFEEKIRKSRDSSLKSEEFSLFAMQDIKPSVVLKFQCNENDAKKHT